MRPRRPRPRRRSSSPHSPLPLLLAASPPAAARAGSGPDRPEARRWLPLCGVSGFDVDDESMQVSVGQCSRPVQRPRAADRPGLDTASNRQSRAAYTASMKIGIVGLGYVGLPLAVAFAEAGHEVVGLDTDQRKVDGVERGPQSHRGRPRTPPSPRSRERFRATPSHADLASCEAVVICVPTPLTSSREPDLTYLLDSATALSPGPPTRAAGRARVDHLPRHHPRALAADPRGVRALRGARLPPRLLAGADRPRAHRLHRAHHAEARRWPHRGLRRARS